MCLALYIAADHPLPIIIEREHPKDAMLSPTWPREAQRFHTAAIRPEQEPVRMHFSHAHVLYAGSYEGCGCGFNFGREYPEAEDDPEHLAASRESIAELVRYLREQNVKEIYVCWFDDESKPTIFRRTIAPEALASPDFFFREQELLQLNHVAQ
jgi:hypothetical protein